MSEKLIIGVNGRIESGKDTFASVFTDLANARDKQVQIIKFADKLKEVASLLLGVSRERFEDQQFKAENLGAEWSNMTVRDFLQKLGTDAVRHGLHPDTWVNATLRDIKESRADIVIVTDLRFPNELDALKNINAKTVGTVRWYRIADLINKFIDTKKHRADALLPFAHRHITIDTFIELCNVHRIAGNERFHTLLHPSETSLKAFGMEIVIHNQDYNPFLNTCKLHATHLLNLMEGSTDV